LCKKTIERAVRADAGKRVLSPPPVAQRRRAALITLAFILDTPSRALGIDRKLSMRVFIYEGYHDLCDAPFSQYYL
jgi:hypothetical protein